MAWLGLAMWCGKLLRLCTSVLLGRYEMPQTNHSMPLYVLCFCSTGVEIYVTLGIYIFCIVI